MFQKKALERRCVDWVARARGGIPEDEDGDWPDGWILDPTGERIPIEVVSAFPEDNGSGWARAYVRAAADAQRIEQQTGIPTPWAVCNGAGVVLAGRTELPPRTRPVDPVLGVFAAIESKTKKYGNRESSRAVLVLHHVQWLSSLDEHNLRRVADHATRTRALFREIWIVNEYGDPAQRIPWQPPNKALNPSPVG
jgi:hypothetical protein